MAHSGHLNKDHPNPGSSNENWVIVGGNAGSSDQMTEIHKQHSKLAHENQQQSVSTDSQDLSGDGQKGSLQEIPGSGSHRAEVHSACKKNDDNAQAASDMDSVSKIPLPDDASEQDELCPVIINFIDTKGKICDSTCVNVNLELAVWLHIKTQENEMESLKHKLKQHNCEITKQSGRIELTCRITHPYSADSLDYTTRPVTNLFEELTQKCTRLDVDGSNEFKTVMLKVWPTTQLYMSHKATAHRTHSGKLCIATKKEYTGEVGRELERISEKYKRETDGCHRLDSATSGHTLPGDSKTLEVTLTDPQFQLLESQQEAQDYVLSFFQKKNIHVTFVFEEKKVILKSDRENVMLNDKIMLDCILTQTETLLWPPPLDSPSSIREGHSAIKGRYILIPDSSWAQVTIVATRDILGVVKDSLRTLLPVIVEKSIVVSSTELQYLSTQNHWEAFEPVLYIVNGSKSRVSVRPVKNDSKCNLFVRGTQCGVEEFENEVRTCLSKQKVNSSSATEKQNLLLFLQSNKKGLKYVENVLQERGLIIEVGEKNAVIRGGSQNITYESLEDLILSTTIYKDDCQLLKLEEMQEMLLEKKQVHQEKLMVDIDKTNNCLVLTGTADIFPDVLREVEDLRSKYTLTEDLVCISTDHMEYVEGKGQSKLKAMVDNPRLKVKMTFLDGEPGLRLVGSKVGVTTVKTWLQKTGTAGGRKAASQNLHADIVIKGHMQKLLKQSSHARQVIKDKSERDGFEIDLDAEYGSAKIHVKHEMHLSKASKMLSTAIGIISFDLGMDHICITPTQLKTLLLEFEPHWAEDVIMDANDSRKELTVCGTMDMIPLVEEAVRNTLHHYEHEGVFLPLDYGTMQLIRTQVDNMFKGNVSLHRSSERVEITGARIHVQQCLVSIGNCLTGQKRKLGFPPKLQVCELVISQLLYMSLEQNRNIRSYLEEKFEDCGYAFALHNARLKLCAASITALPKVWHLFLSHICEMKLSLGKEPVVKLFGIKHMCEKITNNISYQGKVMALPEESTGLLSIVCTDDVKDLVEESILFHKKRCVQSVTDIDHEKTKTELFDLRQLEEAISQTLPDIKGMFKLHVENGKICVVAVREHMKEVKAKIVQILSWKQREAELITTNPYVDIQLSELEYEFLQKPEVISYIDEKLKLFSFGLDMNKKSLKMYCLKKKNLDQGVKDLKNCLKQDEIELLNDPLLENCTLANIKDMLDVQDHIHGGKLLIRIHAPKSSLVMLCTDDVHDAVVDKFQYIKQTCSDVTDFLEMSKEKWDRIRVIFPEDIDAIEKEDVRIEHYPTQLSIAGHAEVAGQVKRKLNGILDKMHVRKFSLLDKMGTLQTHEGQKLLRDAQKNLRCVIKFEKHVKENTAELAVKEWLAQKHLRLTQGCVRLSQWTKNGSSISIIQGHIQDVNTGILVIPTVGGKLPEELPRSLQEDQDLRTLGETSTSRVFSNPKWCKCSSCVFFWIPESLKEGRNQEKETVRRLVKDTLRKAAEDTSNTISCVFVLEALYRTGLQSYGVKCIIKGALEAFKEFKCTFDVQLLTDEKSSNETLKILANACPDSKKISLLRQVEKIKKKMSLSKGKSTEVSKPCLEIVVGALEKQKVDVLVITCRHDLLLSEGVVSKAVDDASHGRLQKECHDKYPHGIMNDELAVTNFHASTASKRVKVYFGALNFFPEKAEDERKEECWKMMYEFIYHCLYQANEEGAESIAFPAIGCGKLGYPNTSAAEVMFNTVEWFFNTEQTLSLKSVHFVLHEKDKGNIKVFNAEKMARSYHVKSFTEDASTSETRHDCGDIILQIIGSSLDKCEETSDGLLCFWNERQLADPSQHPTVGKHLKQFEWHRYASEFTRNGNVLTSGGELPATMIIHTLMKSDFKTALFTGLKSAVNNHCQTVQVELASEDLFDNCKALVADLQAHLKSRHITRNHFCLLTVLIPNPEHYKSVVSELKAASVGILGRPWPFGREENVPTEDHSGSTDDGPQLVVSGTSEEHCKAAYQQVLEGIKQIHAAIENSTSLTDRDDSSSVDFPTPHQGNLST
ncbi:uncharacterized protein LOC124274711 [Haliotis rubra]|uniref:uncharacterized protein LOC124274711 n=1 Tax=Haliotis rubra TaxID=36100 RepID=UPI001EE5D493|nr:uncharacterized protein LOC124274711 [Haliotis rubra]